MSSIKVMILKQNIPVTLGNGIVSAIHCINVCVYDRRIIQKYMGNEI